MGGRKEEEGTKRLVRVRHAQWPLVFYVGVHCIYSICLMEMRWKMFVMRIYRGRGGQARDAGTEKEVGLGSVEIKS